MGIYLGMGELEEDYKISMGVTIGLKYFTLLYF